MKRNLLTLAIILVIMSLGCPKKPVTQAAASGGAAQIAQAPSPAQPPPPQLQPSGPNLSLGFHINFLKDILSGLCTTGYQIYLGDPQNYIIFRELKYVQSVVGAGEVELSMKLEFSVKKYGMKYQDLAETTLRLKLNPVKKDNKVMLQGLGRVVSLKTRFGPTLDDNFLMPQLNKQITKGPLFEVPLSDVAHVLIPWPKLGESARVTELNLTDASIEIQQVNIIFHLTMATQTRLQ